MTIPPVAAHVLGRLVSGLPVNGELDTLKGPWRRIADRLNSISTTKTRIITLSDCLTLCDDADDILSAIRAIDPEAPAPEGDPPRRPATLADVRSHGMVGKWHWDKWLPAARLVGIASFEGVGKSRFCLDLARRIWHGIEWPDRQPATFPPGTKTLWLCADANQDELADAANAMGLPDEAVVLNTDADDPFGGTNLDLEETLTNLEEFITLVQPGLVFVDTLTYATSRDICRAHETKALITPLKDIGQRLGVTIVLLLHVSKDGQALGRRIKGITRTLIHIAQPDPEHQPGRLRLWVEKSSAKKPPALGVSMHDAGNAYDSNPPKAAEPGKAGRPAEKREKAEAFIVDALARENDQIGNTLCAAWEEAKGSRQTFWRAVDDLGTAGKLVKDGGTGTGKQAVLHLNADVNADTPY